VNAIDSFGNTPMHLALEDSYVDFALMLVNDFQADPLIQNKEDKIPCDLIVNESLRRSFAKQLNLTTSLP
jgi:hypothetical protein